MKNVFFQLGAAFAALVLFAIFAFEGKDFSQTLGLFEDEPVLVFTIPNPKHLASIRKAVKADRILEEDDNGIALHGGRVYVNDMSEAGKLISRAGWVERPIQIVSLGVDETEEAEESGTQPKMTREEKLEKLRGLVNKPTLSRGEQMFVLSAMNDGIEI